MYTCIFCLCGTRGSYILACIKCSKADNIEYRKILFQGIFTSCIKTSFLRIKVTPDLHLTYSKNGGNLGLVLKMKNIACLSVL